MQRAGYVLVGGASSRMGCDKALLPYRSSTLVEHIAGTVRSVAGSVTLIGPPERYGTLSLPIISDRETGYGPLGGIITALAQSAAEANLIVACDMPNVDAEVLAELFEAAEASPALWECVAPRSTSGLEPLCAVYHRRALPKLMQAIEAHELKLRSILEKLTVLEVEGMAQDQFRNLNSPEDFR
ncbi:MAG: molybdenum cofactor guanylyltransferase [Acidobacteriaceae bacterium]|nr:molybdenum cofactor guanylyltransferase [Acidobacteriaceae bacterium]MBV9780498.1 molybdenum cofactor guanylyltransferase [Acidobacteriaceae bacterium]